VRSGGARGLSKMEKIKRSKKKKEKERGGENVPCG
jgi:hypothetical protein